MDGFPINQRAASAASGVECGREYTSNGTSSNIKPPASKRFHAFLYGQESREHN